LFGLKWGDIDFAQKTMNVTRSIVYGVVGPCKTESSQKPVPVHPLLTDDLLEWRKRCAFKTADDWGFASRSSRGRKPYWGQAICEICSTGRREAWNLEKYRLAHVWSRCRMRHKRHTFSILLAENDEDVKTVQSLMRHANSNITMNNYTHAVSSKKRRAQSKVAEMILPEQSQPAASAGIA
jgi:integrase